MIVAFANVWTAIGFFFFVAMMVYLTPYALAFLAAIVSFLSIVIGGVFYWIWRAFKWLV